MQKLSVACFLEGIQFFTTYTALYQSPKQCKDRYISLIEPAVEKFSEEPEKCPLITSDSLALTICPLHWFKFYAFTLYCNRCSHQQKSHFEHHFQHTKALEIENS